MSDLTGGPSRAMRLTWTGLGVLMAATLSLGFSRSEASPEVRRRLPSPGDGLVTVEARLDRTSVLQGGDGVVRAEVLLRAADQGSSPRRVPTDLVVVLDRSGSMAGSKIASARESILQILEGLGPGDRFALVSFATGARVDVPLGDLGGMAQEGWRSVVRGISAGGSTNMLDGLTLGIDSLERAESAGRAGRIVLISDGLTSPEGLVAQATRVARREHVLTTVGVGGDFNEFLMTSLADAGTGNFYFLEDAGRLAEVFRSEFLAARETVATGVTVELKTREGVEVVDAAGYPIERIAGGYAFRPGSLFAGQERRTWITYRLPTGRPTSVALGGVSVSYTHAGARRRVGAGSLPPVTCVTGRADYVASIDRDAWSAGVLQEGYSALRQAVAHAVSKGRKSEAESLIDGWVTENTAINADLDDADVADRLEEARQLKEVVGETFAAPNAAARRNSFSKTHQAAAQDVRRSGAKHAEVK